VRIGLDVLFCGFNPGCMSAETGHHFANPTNHFWRALHQGGFTTQFVPASEDHTLPEAYNLGLTNLVERPSAEVRISAVPGRPLLTLSRQMNSHQQS